MIKQFQELWDRLLRNPGRLKATVRVNFYPNKTARASLEWQDSFKSEHDTVSLAIFLYARILFELAELNETRVANELMGFLAQVVDLILTGEGAPNRPRLPMGELSLPAAAPVESPNRRYRGDFYQQQDGQYRMEFKGSLGRLHDYYKFRKDFWDGSTLSAGPVFAMGTAKIGPEETEMEAEEQNSSGV